MVQEDRFKQGKVLKVTRKFYDVIIDTKIVPCVLRGKLAADQGDYCTVRTGDDVEVQMLSKETGVIQRILPRKSQLSRIIESRAYKEHIIATNIDQILIITSTQKPSFKSGLVDRYLIIAGRNQIKPSICINKIDLSSKDKFKIYVKEYSKLGYPTYFISALTGEGVNKIIKILKDRTTLLVGHSGVGKSSLINAIEPGLDITTQSISSKTNKGLHTTSSAQLFSLSFGGFIGDTPGIRELGLLDILKKDLKSFYLEFHQRSNNCRFGDCKHINEPGCDVRKAVAKGEIFRERYENYLNIYSSLKSAHYE